MPSTKLAAHSTENATESSTINSTANSSVPAINGAFMHGLSLANLSSKQQAWLLIGGLFIIVLIWDIWARLFVPSVVHSGKQEQHNIVSAQHSQLDQQTQQAINKLYANFDVPEPEITPTADVKPKLGMSLEEQQAQNGKLDKLFIDDNQYLLSGVFWDKQYFAVLLKIDVNTNTPEEIKVAQGQVFGSYTIEHITKQQITFVNGARTISLSMFK
ncbi:hypothetical protein [Shewanella frigidimarina]|uniref:hypothetical protein n=1 Tax=Shewanella frigidimarina TaxID=56812 RepID=UPI003D7B0D7B